MENERIMKRKGFVRTIESFASALLILAAVVIAYNLVVPANPYISRQQSDLNKFTYNIMQSIAMNNALDNVIFDSKGNLKSNWESQFKIILDSMVLPGIIYNVTVYKVNRTSTTDRWVKLQPFSKYKICNTDSEDSFLKSGEVTEVSYYYTSKVLTDIFKNATFTEKGLCVLLFDVRMARLGGI